MKTLRKRLTALYTITTGAIFLFVMAAFLFSSIQKTRTTEMEQFQMVWNSLSSRLQASHPFSHGFLAQTENDYHMIIHIQENGSPLFYQGVWSPETDRKILISKAQMMAEEEGVFMDRAPVSSSENVSSLMTLTGDHGDSYYAMVLALSTRNGVKSLCAISLIPSVWESLSGQILYLSFLAVSGILCLCLISWWFVGWSLTPVEESQKKQSQFIAAASHELRSPLAVLRSAVAAISTSPQEKDTLLPLIDSECVRMSRLIDDMLLLASSDAKSWKIEKKPVDMDTLLINLFESFQPVCKENGISLHLSLPDQALPIITGDSQRIHQLLMIFLDNALQYTPAGRSIYVRARVNAKKKLLILQVEDEGCGIPPEHKPYIFDRFYQADSARSDKRHVGLGLSIAKELTLLHHGTVRLSDGTECGSCFTVELPYEI